MKAHFLLLALTIVFVCSVGYTSQTYDTKSVEKVGIHHEVSAAVEYHIQKDVIYTVEADFYVEANEFSSPEDAYLDYTSERHCEVEDKPPTDTILIGLFNYYHQIYRKNPEPIFKC